MKWHELGGRLRSALAGYVSGNRTRPFAKVELRPYGGPQDESRVKPWQDSRGHLHYISVVSFESKECPIYPKGAPPQRAIGQLW